MMSGGGQRRVLVIGSGMAGVACARRLAASELGPTLDITIADKGRALGGRLATRTDQGFTWNYGAHKVNCPTPASIPEHLGVDKSALSDELVEGYKAFQDLVKPVSRQVDEQTYRLTCPARDLVQSIVDGLPPSVHLLQAVGVTHIDEELRVKVKAVDGGPSTAPDYAEALAQQRFDAVIVTAPCEQMVTLTPPWPDTTLQALHRVQYNPLACGMFKSSSPDTPVLTPSSSPPRLKLTDPLSNGAVLALSPADEFVGMIRDKRKLLAAMADALPNDAAEQLTPFRAHVWKYSTVSEPLWRAGAKDSTTSRPSGVLAHPTVKALFVAGDWTLGPACADAFVSGEAAARSVLQVFEAQQAAEPRPIKSAL